MNLVIIHKHEGLTATAGENLLQTALSSEPAAKVIMGRFERLKYITSAKPEIIVYTDDISISRAHLQNAKSSIWTAISNGKFAAEINRELLSEVLDTTKADIVAVNAEPKLLAFREKVLLTSEGKVAGFRRLYADSIEPAPIPADWPHHVFIRTQALNRILTNGTLPGSFAEFLDRCRSASALLYAVSIAGVEFDLETERGLLNFCTASLTRIKKSNPKAQISEIISPDARLIGKVLLGKNVHIGHNSVIVGPSIIADDVEVGQDTVISSSVILRNVKVPPKQLMKDRVVVHWELQSDQISKVSGTDSKHFLYERVGSGRQIAFRTWLWFSYVRCVKRLADIIAALIVIILFAPAAPFVVLAIKMTSPGPVFFRDKRQGRHGKQFNCLKFRSMVVGADRIQEKLRIVSQVDGPQFKMEDDPRTNAVGRFLRDTYIDEIPQFINVLLGQMSVVGPRPSPESENTLCPYWRDARLSVRPGITGLWQICRTRQIMRDFQEWIHYDTEYVRNLSLRLDLWICWQTAKKLIWNFIDRF